MSELADLLAVSTDTKKIRMERESVRPDQYESVFDDVLDGCLEATSIAMRVRQINARRRALIAKLDDPVNANDPRRGEAEAKVFRLYAERDDLLKDFEKRCTWIDGRAATLPGDLYAKLVIEISAFAHTSSLLYLVQRLKATRMLPFFVLILCQDIDAANANPPF